MDAKKLDAEVAMLMPLIKVGVGLLPGTNGNLFLAFIQAITSPAVIDSAVALANAADKAKPTP